MNHIIKMDSQYEESKLQRSQEHSNNQILYSDGEDEEEQQIDYCRKCLWIAFIFFAMLSVFFFLFAYHIHMKIEYKIQKTEQQPQNSIIPQSPTKQEPAQIINNIETINQQKQFTIAAQTPQIPNIIQQQNNIPQIYNQWNAEIINQQRNLINLDKSQEQIAKIIYQMKFPTYRLKKFKTNKSLVHIDDIYFAYSLQQYPNNTQFLQAEYYHYHSKYGIGDIGPQLPMCLVMVGRNTQINFKKLYDSIRRQNYTNYHIVHIDDNSSDNTKQSVISYLNKQENQNLKKHTIFIEQKQNKYSLENRDIGISQYCKQNEIVVDLDADDWLIGNQVLQLINTLFQTDSDDLWLLYLNNIIWSPSCRCPLANSDGQIDTDLLLQKKYRTSNIWRTTELRTFRKKLYNKIDKNDFKDKFGNYHQQKSDAFIHFALVEMAAPKHMKIYDQFVYFYETSFAKPSLLRSFSRLAAKVLTPYKSLNSLDEQPQRVQNYQPPKEIYDEFKIKEKLYFTK